MKSHRKAGFTLIELMIVVAIIGLLAAIAIPNFLKFQCKAKQAEAKAGLGAWFISERTFFTEHDTYGTDMVSIHWEPEGTPRYLWGFAQGASGEFPVGSITGITGWDPSRNHTFNSAVQGNPIRYTSVSMILIDGLTPLPVTSLPAITYCSITTFTLGGIADLTAATGVDEWVMTDRRSIVSTNNDCSNL